MNLPSYISIVTVFVIIILSLSVFLRDYKSTINRNFLYLCISIILWITSNIFANNIRDYSLALFCTQIAIIWTALLPIFFNRLIKYLYYPNDEIYNKKYLCIYYTIICTLILITLCSFTSLNIKSISLMSWGLAFEPGILYYILFLHLFVGFGFSFYGLVKIAINQIHAYRLQAIFILIGACLTVSISILFDIIFPILGNPRLSLYAPLTTIIFIFGTSLAISKYSLFKIKILTIEIIIFLLWIFILIKILLDYDSENKFWGLGVWALSIVFGIILIRNILHLLSLNEKIENLTKELSRAYSKIKELSE